MAKKTCKQREDLRKAFSADGDTAGKEHLVVRKVNAEKLIIIVTFNSTKKEAMDHVKSFASSGKPGGYKDSYMSLAQLDHHVNDLGWKWFHSS